MSTFNAGDGYLQTSGPLRFHPDCNLGNAVLTFASGKDGQPDPDGDLKLSFPQGDSAENTVVSLDGGQTWSSLTVVSGGTVSPKANNNFFKDFPQFSADNPPTYLVIEVGGEQYIFFPDFPEASGRLSGNIFLNESDVHVFVCFLRGTRIMTPQGLRAVEDLRPGDLVCTRDSGDVPLRWVGASRVPVAARTAPVCIRAGAMGAGLPERDLKVSPLHRIVVASPRLEVMFGFGEALVSARDLVDGTDVVQDFSASEVEYFHLLFDRHEIVLAEGLPTESFHPGIWGMSVMEEAMRKEILDLFPALREDVAAYGPSARPGLRWKEALAVMQD